MGYYTEISNNKEYAAKDVALYNRMNGVSGHTVAGVVLSQTLPSIFMTLTTKIVWSFVNFKIMQLNFGIIYHIIFNI